VTRPDCSGLSGIVPGRLRLPLLFVSALLLSSSTLQAAILAISPQQMQRLGIRTATVRAAETQPVASLLGRVTPAPDSRVPVFAPFAGSVRSLIRLEGERVKKGDALAVIASADMRAALGRLQGQEAQYRSARAAAERARLLVREGIAPASRAEEAEAASAAAGAELAAAQTAMARASRSSDGTYRLLAPESGRIASVETGSGAQVAAMQPLMTIDTRAEYWIEGGLPARAVGQVAPGDLVRLDGMPQASGTVMAAGSTIDPRSRTATVRARMTDPAALVSGQTVRLTILRRAAAGALTVPRIAVVELRQGPAVFVARRGGFEAVPVRVMARGPVNATISGKLAAGDRVAIAGLSELKAASAVE
jgi:cobalt-zinc-cadmium efflux system membrane fusion protein